MHQLHIIGTIIQNLQEFFADYQVKPNTFQESLHYCFQEAGRISAYALQMVKSRLLQFFIIEISNISFSMFVSRNSLSSHISGDRMNLHAASYVEVEE